MLVTA